MYVHSVRIELFELISSIFWRCFECLVSIFEEFFFTFNTNSSILGFCFSGCGGPINIFEALRLSKISNHVRFQNIESTIQISYIYSLKSPGFDEDFLFSC